VPADGLTIESALELAELRAAIGGELTAENQGIILGVLAAATAASTMVVWTLVMLRRRDFGRRRALGATRQMIVGLTVGQVLLLASVGSLCGTAIGVGWLALAGHPVPTAAYLTAVAVTFALSTAIVSAIPGAWAARRDPLVELRVP
jgi:putative ABC transport system permease protein